MPSNEEQAAIRRVLADVRSPCILDIGAHTGDEEQWLRAACRPGECHYVMVEPDPRNCQAILDKSSRMSRTSIDAQVGALTVFSHNFWLGTRRLIIGAVSDRNEMREFHFAYNVKDRSHASGSLREPTGHKKHIPEVKFTGVGLVQCYTLDTIFEKEWLTKVDLLWLDVQGSERECFLGGAVTLKHTCYLFCEVEKVELYQGEALRDELVSMLAERSFVIEQEFEFNILFRNTNFFERGPR